MQACSMIVFAARQQWDESETQNDEYSVCHASGCDATDFVILLNNKKSPFAKGTGFEINGPCAWSPLWLPVPKVESLLMTYSNVIATLDVPSALVRV
ncbi:unnamed protein product [Dovyalis caffra]|uniref:Uncharacterized protein n=1 Tax=Dovyalis caffra TaxID=77055 RepID=A0AAV1QXL0_9ROSI|nr:unnamed protein product [Dovyalis caffra]